MITGVIIAAIVVGVVGILVGVLLGVASEKFAIEVDPREIAVREALPGNNCGGCGYPGCDGLAKAIACGEAEVNRCPVGGAPVAAVIAEIMGVSAGESEKRSPLFAVREHAIRAKKNTITLVSQIVIKRVLFQDLAESLVPMDVWDLVPASRHVHLMLSILSMEFQLLTKKNALPAESAWRLVQRN